MRQCVDIILECGFGKILLIERGSLPCGWAMPGGYVDEGERPLDAAVRETLEETGLEIEIGSAFRSYSFVDEAGTITCTTIVFVAKVLGGTAAAASDAVGLRAFDLDELPELIPAHVRILDDYAAALVGKTLNSQFLPSCPYSAASSAA